MPPARLLISSVVVAVALLCGVAHAQEPAASPGRERHFVDFRARAGALMGHTYIIYGRLNGAGRPVEMHVAGLYPNDDYRGLVLGSLVPVGASVRAVKEDLVQTPSAIYRRPLSAREYARLKAEVRRLRATERTWHMWLHNCNAFAQSVAQSLGLATPPHLLVPNAWVRALRAMNGG